MYLITLVLTILIFCAINYTYSHLQKLFIKDTVNDEIIYEEKQTDNIVEISKETEIKEPNTNSSKEEIWQIEIPCIDLVAPIKEGTSQDILLNFVGHFENTNILEGNVGLAAHNRRISYKLFCQS